MRSRREATWGAGQGGGFRGEFRALRYLGTKPGWAGWIEQGVEGPEQGGEGPEQGGEGTAGQRAEDRGPSPVPAE